MTEIFDLVVIGSGSAGSAAAGRCRRAGWSVAVVDERPFGGTCALRGCDPKKVLVGVAETLDATRRLRGRGIAGEGWLDWTDLMAFKRTFTDPYPEKKERAFRDSGVEVVKGHARFTGPTSIEAAGRTLNARHVLIAAGARPAALAFPGADCLVTSDDFLDLSSLPPSVAFVGGGYISFEFAHVAARAGSSVTILHRGARPLEGFDPDLVDLLVRHSRALGIDVRTGTEVYRIDRDGSALVLHARSDRGDERFAAGLAVHGAGRVPAIQDLDLEAAGISYTGRGIDVNEYLQSVSNPAVFAAGDIVNRGPALTPVAGHDGTVVADNLLSGVWRTVDYTAVPSVVFTIPALAAVGLLEDEARRRGLDIEVHSGDTSGWYSSRRVGETTGGYKTLTERGTGRIVGAHLLGPHASELINVFAIAVRLGTPAAHLKNTLFAYPTGASDLQYML